MRRTLKIAEREYIETAKTKTFLFGVLMAPIIIVAIAFFAGRAARDEGGPRPPVKVALTDLSRELSEDVESGFEKYNESHSQRQLRLEWVESEVDDVAQVAEGQKQRLRNNRLDVYVVVENDIISGDGRLRFYTCGTKAATFDVPFAIENIINRAVFRRRCELQELSPAVEEKLGRAVRTEHVDVGSAGEQEKLQSRQKKMAQMMVPFFFMYLMFLGIFLAAQHMLTSVIEEKSSRVVEVLLSAVSPLELMTGKILGLVGIGLTVIGLWAGAAYGAARWKGLSVEVTGELLIYFVVYFVLGFVLFSSVMAGIGSICNTLKETQSLMMPVSLICIVPLISWFNLAKHPDGTYARVLSFVPPLTPMVMILRLSSSSSIRLPEIAGTMAVLAAAVLALMCLTAKVFRTGILMYGKRPRVREVLRWLKER